MFCTPLRCAAAVVCLVIAVGCGGRQGSGAAHPDDAVVVFDCPIRDASVWVNGRYIEPIRDLSAGIALAPGKSHFIEVKHDRYHTFYAELSLQKRERRTLIVRLAEILP
jgi:hypothetical protein